MAAPSRNNYDRELSDQELSKLTGVDADEERRIEAAAHSAHQEVKDLEDNYRAPAAKEKDVSTESLADAEQTNNGTIDNGYERDSQEGGGARGRFKDGLKQKLKGAVTKKRAAIGGGILSGVLILAIMAGGFSAFELINLRENALGKGNRHMNRVLQKRRAQTFGYMLHQLQGGDTARDPIQTDAQRKRFKEAFEKQGFKVVFDGKELKEFSFTDKYGEKRSFNLNNDDPLKATNDFFGATKDSKFGLEASKSFDKVHASTGSLWRGPGARIVYGAYKFAFFNWLDAKPSDKAKTIRQKFADVLRKSNATEAALSARATKTKQELGDGQKANENESPTKVTDTAETLDGAFNNNMSAEEYQQKMLANPQLTDSVLGVADDANVEDLVSGTEKAMDSGGFKSEEQLTSLGKGVFKGSLTSVLRAFNIVGVVQTACEVKGILNFVSNYRNVVMSIELARFAIRILNAADDQKAGIVSAEGLNLLMIYLTNPNPKTGKGHTGAGGEQFMFGDTAAKPSRLHRSMYGVGRNNDGILGRISNFVNQVPGMSKCNIVNNGAVTVAGFAVGIVAAVASGGTITGAQLATMLTLAAAKEIVIQVGTPLLIKAGAHMIASGYENGEQAGDMFASGMGSLQGMVGGASGMRPSTNTQIVAMEAEMEAYERSVVADQSVFERYFSPHNSQSLASHVAMSIPSSLHAAAISFSSGLTGFMQNITSFGAISYLMPGSSQKALALQSGCTDPQVKKLNIATDPFCNPIMADSPEINLERTREILLATKQIDDTYKPTDTKQGDDKSFNEYIKLCFSGRPGILYNPSPDQEGSEEFTDDTCTQKGSPLPGDSVGRYTRFAAWYGYLNDSTSMLEQIGIRNVQGETIQ